MNSSLREANYSSAVTRLLESSNVKIFDRVRIRLRDGSTLSGVVLPRAEVGDPDCMVIKLDNGYNVGISVDRVEGIEVVESAPPSPLVEKKLPRLKPGLPPVHFLGTGGTIASRIDYKTGAVYPFFTAEEIYSMVPELEDMALIKAENLYSIFSEDMRPRYWERIAEASARALEEGARGVVIAHGTDTMGYTAAALAFAVRRSPGPIVLVGAQRSSDRPSSDSALNVIAAAITAIEAPFAESVVAMHGSISDDYCLVHRGVRVRKCHTSRRDAFRSVNDLPLAIVKFPRTFRLINPRYTPRSKEGILVEPHFDDRVALVKFYPGMPGEIIDALVDRGFHGIVLEGTGLGHVSSNLLPSIRRAVEEEIPVVMTSQCIWGRINMNVYRRGIELLRIGVIPGGDMLPETAYVKLSWILGATRDLDRVRRLMGANIANEISDRTEHRTYPPVWLEGGL